MIYLKKTTTNNVFVSSRERERDPYYTNKHIESF